MTRGRPKKKVEEAIKKVVEEVGIPATVPEGTLPLNDILEAPATESIKLVIAPKVYEVPSTREDFLALHKCLRDTGIHSIGDLEVRAAKL